MLGLFRRILDRGLRPFVERESINAAPFRLRDVIDEGVVGADGRRAMAGESLCDWPEGGIIRTMARAVGLLLVEPETDLDSPSRRSC